MDEDLHEDLSSVMEDNHQMILDEHPPDSFMAIFWSQQRHAASLKNAKSMKWEAAMIRWCLYLRHLSSSAYELLRNSGVLKLPSQRTLRDYTYYTDAATGS